MSRRISTSSEPGELKTGAASTDVLASTSEYVGESRWEKTKSNAKTIGGAVLLAVCIRILLFEAFEIEGPSMEPTLVNGDRVVVAKFLYGLFLPFTRQAVLNWGVPNPGDIVIVKSPLDEIDIVKRIIGLPGDTIEIRDDVVYRNGKALKQRDLGVCRDPRFKEADPSCKWVEERAGDKTYRTSHSAASAPSNYASVTVPPGHVYILGDHRDRSNDSRFFGAVPVARVKGKGLVIYWSSDRTLRWDRFFQSVR